MLIRADRMAPVGVTPTRLLVVTASFPPDAAVGILRTVRLLKHLADGAWKVDVLTLSPASYRRGTVTDMAMAAQIPDGVRVHRAAALRPFEHAVDALRGASQGRPGPTRKTGPSAVGEGAPARAAGGLRDVHRVLSAALALPDREVSWILPAVYRGWQVARSNSPDVIYSSGPPFSAHLVAAGLALLLRRPWVADFRDPWARAPWREDRFAFERWAWDVLERLVVKRADVVVFVTRANERDFAIRYGDEAARRFELVPNGCDVADFEALTPRPRSDRFVLLHAGSLYGGRNPAPLFAAVARALESGAIHRDRFRVRLIGRTGVPGMDLVQYARDLGLADVIEFVPHMPRHAVLQEMLDASALLIVQPVTRVSVPGKLYEYLCTGRPILALAEPDGETAGIVRQSPVGAAVAPTDEMAILEALTAMVAAGGCGGETDPSVYDGARRASELETILRRAARERMPVADERGSEAVPVRSKQL